MSIKDFSSVPSFIKLIVLVSTNEAIQKLLDFFVLCFLFIFYAILFLDFSNEATFIIIMVPNVFLSV